MIPLVDEITPELTALAAGPSASGRGGMRTKLEAAEIAMNCGGTAVIANGNVPDTLDRIFAGEKIGTAFLPAKRMRGKRRWIAYAADVRGRVVVDAGAHRAITQGKGELAGVGHRARGKPFRLNGRGEHRGWRRARIRARHRQLRQRRRRKVLGKEEQPRLARRSSCAGSGHAR